MKKLFKLINVELNRNKRIYTFIIILMLIGIITGSLFITILNSDDKKLIIESLTEFFNTIKSSKYDYLYIFRTSFISSLIYLILLFILGISIIGIPIIIFIIFMKSFIIGFSIGAIIYKFGFKGILISISYIFPHQILNLIAICFIGLYALKVSISLIRLIISKKQINFKLIIKKYSVVLLICVFLNMLSSLFETFIMPSFISLFKIWF